MMMSIGRRSGWVAAVLVIGVVGRAYLRRMDSKKNFEPQPLEAMPVSSAEEWPFDQPKNAMAIVTLPVLEGKEPIVFASHDEDDGGWQFLGLTRPNDDNGRVMSMEQIVARDPSLRQVAGLKPGERAARADASQPWMRIPANMGGK